MGMPCIRPMERTRLKGVRAFARGISSGRPGRHRAAAQKKPERDRNVEQIPGYAVGEGSAVGAGNVEDRAGHPAAQRHANNVAIIAMPRQPGRRTTPLALMANARFGGSGIKKI
jgi:hypothetical protein